MKTIADLCGLKNGTILKIEANWESARHLAVIKNWHRTILQNLPDNTKICVLFQHYF